MIATTMIITLLVANIPQLRGTIYLFFDIPIALMFIASILQLVLLFTLNLDNVFPVNYLSASLSVLTSSSGLAVATAWLDIWTLLSWGLSALFSVIAVVVGYRMRRLNLKGYYVMYYVISGLMILGGIPFVVLFLLKYKDAANLVFGAPLVFCLIVALYLTGQGLKSCNGTLTDSFIPFRQALITWALVCLMYITLSRTILVIRDYIRKNNQIVI
nr:unnamed protein product [Trichobilharzia regenti]